MAENIWAMGTKASGSNFLACQLTQPSAADFPDTGWDVNLGGGTAAGEFADLYANVLRASTTFTGGAAPTALDTTNGNGYRLFDTPRTGSYAAGNWTFPFRVKRTGSSTGWDVRVSFLLFRSANADGSSATAIGTRQVTSTATDLSTGTNVTVDYDPSGGAGFSLTAEYLFLAIALEIVGTQGTADTIIFRQAGAVTPTHGVISTTFTASGGGFNVAWAQGANQLLGAA